MLSSFIKSRGALYVGRNLKKKSAFNTFSKTTLPNLTKFYIQAILSSMHMINKMYSYSLVTFKVHVPLLHIFIEYL